jgi:hypothetical protein
MEKEEITFGTNDEAIKKEAREIAEAIKKAAKEVKPIPTQPQPTQGLER